MKLKIEVEVKLNKQMTSLDKQKLSKFITGSMLCCSFEVNKISIKEIKELVNPEVELLELCDECNIPLDNCNCIKKYSRI